MKLLKLKREGILVLILLMFLSGTVNAGPFTDKWDSFTKEEKAIGLNLGLASLITIWGVGHWDYFQTSPKATPEGWFDYDSGEGGADKMGHAFTSYALSHAMAATYRRWGFDYDTAGKYGALSAWGVQAFMEFGDSFSRYGFSYEDFLANTIGSAVGYLSWKYPDIQEKVDFRLEYAPDFSESDFFTDYEHQKFVLAFKLAGYDSFRNTPLKYLEFQTGYYSRGYDNQFLSDNERIVYFGIGINLSQIARQTGHKKLGTFLRYYQVPYTYLPIKHEFDD